ncbi:MAG: L-threonine 3-dehydrogenase [Oscillospiraceae bacterium]|nr:L-threonine 3-dehydrogenase [Oscillospiraceae bacterium]
MGKNTMSALVKEKPGPGLTYAEVPIPEVGAGQVMIKVLKTAICGTDLHIYNWDAWSERTVKTPQIIGHEFVGEVFKLGEGVIGYKEGELVSGEGHIICNTCRNCLAGRRHLCANTIGVGVNRDGCFAEYLVIPAENVVRVASGIPLEVASFFDALGNAVHTALKFDLTGEDVIITGAGPIGVMAAIVCRHCGAKKIAITDYNEHRLELAKEAVPDIWTADPRKVAFGELRKKMNVCEGFDIGLEMSGAQSAFKDMVEHMNNGGRIALLGIHSGKTAINWDKVVFKGLTIMGIYGREMFDTWYKMMSMLQTGLDVSKVITHRFDAKDFEKGFAAMQNGDSGKVVLDWGNGG